MTAYSRKTPVPDWAYKWAVSRIKGDPKPSGVPGTVSNAWSYAWEWLTFVEWRVRGGLPPRPPSISTPVPKAWWDSVFMVKALLKPPEPKPDPILQLKLPVLYVTDAGTAVSLAKRAADSGFGSIALQNTTYTPDDQVACTRNGLVYHLWGVARHSDLLIGPACYQPQIEGPGQADAAITELTNSVTAPPHANTIRGIITNFGGLAGNPNDDSRANAVAALTDYTFVECYAIENPTGPYADLPRMCRQATIYGLPNPIPVPEFIRGQGAEVYPTLPQYKKNFGVWRGEQMPDHAWQQVRNLVDGKAI